MTCHQALDDANLRVCVRDAVNDLVDFIRNGDPMQPGYAMDLHEKLRLAQEAVDEL